MPVMLLLMPTSPLYAEQKSDVTIFQALFEKWTYSFNHQNLPATCNLFSPALSANYQGVAAKNYASICAGFKKIFQETQRHYHYRFKLHHVYHCHDLAVARMTWYLQINEQGKPTSLTRDEGIDVLQKNKQGQWQIVNYLAYPVINKEK